MPLLRPTPSPSQSRLHRRPQSRVQSRLPSLARSPVHARRLSRVQATSPSLQRQRLHVPGLPRGRSRSRRPHRSRRARLIRLVRQLRRRRVRLQSQRRSPVMRCHVRKRLQAPSQGRSPVPVHPGLPTTHFPPEVPPARLRGLRICRARRAEVTVPGRSQEPARVVAIVRGRSREPVRVARGVRVHRAVRAAPISRVETVRHRQ